MFLVQRKFDGQFFYRAPSLKTVGKPTFISKKLLVLVIIPLISMNYDCKDSPHLILNEIVHHHTWALKWHIS